MKFRAGVVVAIYKMASAVRAAARIKIRCQSGFPRWHESGRKNACDQVDRRDGRICLEILWMTRYLPDMVRFEGRCSRVRSVMAALHVRSEKDTVKSRISRKLWNMLYLLSLL